MARFIPVHTMDPASKGSRLLEILKDGPATVGELYAELADEIARGEWTRHQVRAHVDCLFRRKKISRDLFGSVGGKPRYLWKLAA
ncbi:hypothetical protein [Dyella japonica]|uniref:OmpR/PhoB-type domain-containing protein n=1 Tax=Dyella japonica DSM 16301 TaxID=1440762 RepID=A0A0G9H7I9_9GAMM|nr:hypothetical protein [Dyella japonica]KLD65451.1 hypothetical protein Y882_02735 [Dyella japonica DSM 16301]